MSGGGTSTLQGGAIYIFGGSLGSLIIRDTTLELNGATSVSVWMILALFTELSEQNSLNPLFALCDAAGPRTVENFEWQNSLFSHFAGNKSLLPTAHSSG